MLGLLALVTHQTASAQSTFGNALSLNGVTQGIVVSNFGTIIPTNEVTVEFWAYTTKAAQQSAVMLSPDANSNRFNIHLNYGSTGDGAIYWDFANTGANLGRLGNVPAPTNSINNWVHYAFVASQSANSMSIYTNGVLYTNKTGMSTFVRGTYNLMIGCATNYPYHGTLDELRVWSAARSATEIQANYKTPLIGNEANLLLYYKFDSAAGTVATNSATSTGAVYNGTLTNSPTWVSSMSSQTASTLPVTGNTNTVAQLNGTVNAGSISTTAWFEWGSFTTSNTNTTTPVTITNGTVSNVSNVVSGLIPGRIYHYQIVAGNALGVVRGNDVMFGAPSVVLNNAASLTNECPAAFTDPFSSNPVTIIGMPLSVSGGGNHDLGLRNDRTVSAWGLNTSNQTSGPLGLSNVVAIDAGFNHSLALKSDGTVIAWGAGTNDVGTGYSHGQSIVPSGLSNVVAIAAGYTHSVALKSNGTVVVWGDPAATNSPANLTNAMAVAAGQVHTLALASNGTVVAWGFNVYTETNVPAGLSNVVAISAGSYHSLALKSDGTVVAWGAGTNNSGSSYNYGQSLIPAGLSNVIAIAAGGYHNLALKSDGTVSAWGYNGQNQTAVPLGLSNVVAIAAGDSHSLALKTDGTLVGWGLSVFGITTAPADLTNLTATVTTGGTFNTNNSPGSYSLTYIVTNGLGGIGTASRTVAVQDKTPPIITLLGSNPMTNAANVPFVDPGATALDACGGSQPVTTNNTVNVAVPGTYTVTYTSTDSSSNTTNAIRTVVITPSPLSAVTLAPGGGSNNVITLNGTFDPGGLISSAWFEWGLSPTGTTNTTLPVVATAAGTTTISNQLSGLTPGNDYYYRAVASNSFYGVMRGISVRFNLPKIILNGPSTLANECHTPFTDTTSLDGLVIGVAGGYRHSLALKTNGTVVAWGQSTLDQTSVPTGLSNVVAIASGGFHNLALLSDRSIVVWGDNSTGQTNVPAGLSNVVAIAGGNYHSVAIKNDGTVVAWGFNASGQTNVPPGLSNVVAIAAGDSHSLAVKSNGTVVAWGINSSGQTNVPAGLSNVVALAGGITHSVALKSNGTIVAWGGNFYGQTNVPAGLTNAVAIAAGSIHSMALKSNGTVVAWGSNGYGQTTVPAGLSNVVAIAAGAFHSLALRNDGTVVAWGDDSYGQTTIADGLNMSMTVSGSVDINTPGTHVLNYTASNSFGITTASRTVVVQDTMPPVITLVGNNPLTNFLHAPLIDPGATALDSCGGSFAVTSNNNVNANLVGSYTITYTSTDSYSNTTNLQRTVWVVDAPGYSGFNATVIGTNAANGSRTVQFTAAVNPNGLDSSVNFQFGLTSAYPGTEGPVSVPRSFNTGNVTVTVPGFSSGVIYHWNVTGTNLAGGSSSPDQTFTIGTLPGNGIPGDIDGDGIVTKSELDAVYGNYLSNSPWLYMTNVMGLGGTNVIFSLTNSPGGVSLTVEYTTNLVDWHPLGAATPRFEFNDTNAPATPVRHYRLVYP